MMIPNHIYIFLVFFFLVPAKATRPELSSSSLKTRVLQQVSCGGHYAPSCAECPQGYGAAWCNGECKWENGACVDRLVGCSDATTNNECTTTSEDCSWNTWTNLCRQKLSDDVRTASVHLNYDIPGTVEKPAWFFQRIVPQATADATYLSSNGHRFGYGGIQRVQGNVGRVLFSLWDQGGCDQDLGGCDPDNVAITVACGDGVTCTSFGNEGTGRKSYYDKNDFPKNDNEYFMVTQAAPVQGRNDKMEYTGYFYDDDEGKWRLLSRIQVSTNTDRQWWLSSMYSFVEQWTATQPFSDRGALYGPCYMASQGGSNNIIQVPSVRFSYGRNQISENHDHVNSWQAGADEKYAVGIETGGNAVQEVAAGTSFDYEPVDFSEFAKLQDFSTKIECLEEASSKTMIETCLLSSTPPPTPAPTPNPTPPPTPQPTPAPTPPPTPEPTPAPTPPPTPAPTPAPTPPPTLAPLPGPTPQPTLAPLPGPTPQPTPPPTVAPLTGPTPQPTPQPTVAPLPGPTPQPTPAPTPEPTSSAGTTTTVLVHLLLVAAAAWLHHAVPLLY